MTRIFGFIIAFDKQTYSENGIKVLQNNSKSYEAFGKGFYEVFSKFFQAFIKMRK